MDAARERGRGGGTRASSWLAWSLAGLSMVMFVASIPLCLLARSAHVPSSWGADLSIVGLLLGGGLFLLFPLVGALIASRRQRNPIGWILLADGLLWMLSDVMDYYAVYGVASPGSIPFPAGVAGINNWLWVDAVGLLRTYVFLLSPGILENLGGIRNPFGLEGFPWVETAPYVVLPLLPLCMLASVFSLVLRYRRSRGGKRQQIKWIAFAASFLGLLYLIAMIGSFIFPQETWFAAGSPLWVNLLEYAALLSFTLVPTAVGFAVLRYRLYDIDILINRTLVYGALTAMLVALYLGGVATTHTVLHALTGQQQQPQLSFVVTTLVIAALFNPLRRRIQSFIDRRFYRRKYDAAKTLSTFSAKLRNETDLEQLNAGLLSFISATMQPGHVSLWLKPADRELNR